MVTQLTFAVNDERKRFKYGTSILDAAEKVFLEKGYLKVTTAEIAKEAGINHSLLHYYFSHEGEPLQSGFPKEG